MGAGSIESGNPLMVTGNGSAQTVLARDGIILGYMLNSGASPTLSAYDSASAAGISTSNQYLAAVPLTAGAYVGMRTTLRNGLTINLTAGAVITFIVS